MPINQIKVRRRRESAISLATIALILLMAGVTWFDINSDRKHTLEDAVANSQAALTMAEATWEATLRDATNAALSAVLLIEDERHGLKGASEARLHEELKRELWNEAGAARLMLVSAEGNVLASSAEASVQKQHLKVPAEVSQVVQQAAGHPLQIGVPQKSVVSGEDVLPIWFDLAGPANGAVRAEIRVSTFERAFRAFSSRGNGSLVVLSPYAGKLLLYVPRRTTANITPQRASLPTCEIPPTQRAALKFARAWTVLFASSRGDVFPTLPWSSLGDWKRTRCSRRSGKGRAPGLRLPGLRML